MKLQDIENLAFRGAGVKGVAYSPVPLLLEQFGVLSQIKKVAGTSAGSIIAMLMAAKFSPKEIFDITMAADFSTFADGNLITDLETIGKYGYHPGKTLLAWFQKILSAKIAPTATFADFKKAGFLDLHIFAADLNTESLRRFSNETTPNAPVAEAMRCSVSIPEYFQAYRFDSFDKHIYVDGGLTFNYPLKAFDKPVFNPKTLGFYIGVTSDIEADSGLDFHEPKAAGIALIETLLKAQDEQLYSDPEDMARTIFLSPCGISSTNFNITEDEKMLLFKTADATILDVFTKAH